MKMGVFESLYQSLIGYIVTFDAKQSAVINILSIAKDLITIGLTISILWTAFQVMLNRNTSPFNEVLWSMFKKAIVLSVVFGSVNWINYASPVAQEAYNLFSQGGGDRFPAMLDKNLKFLANEFTDSMTEKLTFGAELIIIPFYIVATFIVFAIVSLITMSFLILTTITSHLLVVVLPFAIISLLYNQTKEIFAQWLKLFISNLLTVLLGFLVIEVFLINIFNAEFQKVATSKSMEYTSVLVLFIVTLIGVKVFLMAISLAQNLVGVSLDMASGAGGGATAALGAGGTAMGMASRLGTSGAKIGSAKALSGAKIGGQMVGNFAKKLDAKTDEHIANMFRNKK
ncbi:type IV secretion system protein [Campylobacter devanensis]|uniref:type IV secretion system protein n=1 Tax=Campylobacter devanensis TaxID=3161138 RepID=UPI000A32BD87|nr:type IV secretion system protein [Campylobacter sp. P0136]